MVAWLPQAVIFTRIVKHCIFSFVALALLLSGCRSLRGTSYLTDVAGFREQAIPTGYAAAVQPDDELGISVVSAVAEGVVDVNTHGRTAVGGWTSADELARRNYRVSSQGNIVVPGIGTLRVAGLGLDSVASLVAKRLADSAVVKDAQVTVRRLNFTVSVIGEVAKPGMYHVEGERITIFEALAMAGDATMQGLRDSVIVMRMEQQQETPIFINLSSKNAFLSEAYYLHPNDIVYVEISDRKKRQATLDKNVPQYISMGISALRIASLLTLTQARGGYVDRSKSH